ncbi:MAG: hypothetical protein E7381_03335 [Clostridiales bacterium]|nr:hypothetical protein [Clostridiales bacterium]
MNYVKKMCILRQVKQGFSGDGKTLSGLIKAEQYGKNLAIEVSVINFAPLSSGEYYCILSDGKSHAETLPLRGKSLFNILTDMDISEGFCAIICFVKDSLTPIAYGVNGNGSYHWKSILDTALPPSFRKKEEGEREFERTLEAQEPPLPVTEPPSVNYDDETVATQNYYEENTDEQDEPTKNSQNAPLESASEEQDTKEGANPSQNGNADGVLHPFTTDTDGYYQSVKSEMDGLLQKYPKDDTLKGAFCCSEWIRVKGEADNPQYLVGLVYEEGKVKYVCYALSAEDKNNPPSEIRDVCTFVPTTPFSDNKGFFIIFQSASTGECIKPIKT